MSRFDRRQFLRAAAIAGTVPVPISAASGARAVTDGGWEWTGGEARFESVNDVASVGDGVVLAGTVAEETEPSAGFGARLTADGEVVWRQRYVSDDQQEALEAEVFGPIPQDGVSAVLPAPEGDGVLLVGWTYHDNTAVYVSRLVRIGPDGDVRWERSLSDLAPDLAYGYLAGGTATDDGYLLCGMGSPGILLGGAGWLVSLDRGGGLDWQRLYPATDRNLARTSRRDVFRAAVPTREGYVLGGHYEPHEGGDARSWLVGVDPTGEARWEDRFDDGPSRTYGLAASEAEAYDLLAVGAIGSRVDPGDRQYGRPRRPRTEGDGVVAAYTASGDRVWRERLPGTVLFAAGHGSDGIVAGGARWGRNWVGAVGRTDFEADGEGAVAALGDDGRGGVLAAGRRRRPDRIDAWARSLS